MKVTKVMVVIKVTKVRKSRKSENAMESERLANTKFDVFHKGFYCRTHVRDPDFFGSVSLKIFPAGERALLGANRRGR